MSIVSILFGGGKPKDSGHAQNEWKQKTLSYVKAANAFVEKGHRLNWENVGEEPRDPGREHLAKAAISAVRRANADGTHDTLRDAWPPAHAPLIPILEKEGQNIPVVCILGDGSIVARIGANHPHSG